MHRGYSHMTGELMVRDIEVRGHVFRQLIFSTSKDCVQSVARMLLGRFSSIQTTKAGIFSMDMGRKCHELTGLREGEVVY